MENEVGSKLTVMGPRWETLKAQRAKAKLVFDYKIDYISQDQKA